MIITQIGSEPQAEPRDSQMLGFQLLKGLGSGIQVAQAFVIFIRAPDKVPDDVIIKICHDNNEPLGSINPGVKCNQS